jgi:tRNA pseudouridine38-40 synthase
MKRYFLEIAYDGTNYHGWQIQNNASSVQGELNKVLSLLLKEEINVSGCGRTDTGVHARQFYLHFDTVNEAGLENLIYKMNSFLPFDIAVRKLIAVQLDAHTRFDATSRTYEYHIHTQKDPFLKLKSHYLSKSMNVEAMNAAGEVLKEYKDFEAFSKVNTDVKTFICQLKEARWEQQGSELCFTITADRFLRNMVRAVVGTMLEVGLGKTDLDGLRKVVEGKNRSEAGASVPACGLYLTNVVYPYID